MGLIFDMKKIDKTSGLLSDSYQKWLKKENSSGKPHKSSYRYYYDDVCMDLYRCQKGVCAYTEMYICISDLYTEKNWNNGKYKIPNTEQYSRLDHLGEMDHFNPDEKSEKYWNWNNLFMIHAKINSIKTNTDVVEYLKPDLTDYDPQKYFDYDEITHRFTPNTDIADPTKIKQIQIMIDNVLCLNQGVVRNERRDYLNLLKQKKVNQESFVVDRFFTAANWVLGV